MRRGAITSVHDDIVVKEQGRAVDPVSVSATTTVHLSLGETVRIGDVIVSLADISEGSRRVRLSLERLFEPRAIPEDDAVAALVAATSMLGEPNTWGTPDGYDSLALSTIDSIWSIGVRYQGVRNVIERYRAMRAALGCEADADTPDDLVQVVEECGGPEAFASLVQNRQRTSSRNGILKAEAVYLEARMLSQRGVSVPADIAGADARDLEVLASEWSSVKGQGSGISWKYFLMLARVPGVKPDRMIRRFVAAALRRTGGTAVGVDEAARLVTAAATRLSVSPLALDYAIWEYQSSLRAGVAAAD